MAFALNQAMDKVGNKKLFGGYTLLGGDYSGNDSYTLIHDPRNKTAWYVPAVKAAEVKASIALNMSDVSGGDVSGSVQGTVSGFLGIFGTTVSGGSVIDTETQNSCRFIEVCLDLGFGLGIAAGGGGTATVGQIQQGASTSHNFFYFGGKGVVGLGSVDVSSGGATLDIGGGSGGAVGYRACIRETSC